MPHKQNLPINQESVAIPISHATPEEKEKILKFGEGETASAAQRRILYKLGMKPIVF